MDKRATTVSDIEASASVTQERPVRPCAPPRRQPPPMRIVTKGWWTLEEGTADIEELRQGGEHK